MSKYLSVKSTWNVSLPWSHVDSRSVGLTTGQSGGWRCGSPLCFALESESEHFITWHHKVLTGSLKQTDRPESKGAKCVQHFIKSLWKEVRPMKKHTHGLFFVNLTVVMSENNASEACIYCAQCIAFSFWPAANRSKESGYSMDIDISLCTRVTLMNRPLLCSVENSQSVH